MTNFFHTNPIMRALLMCCVLLAAFASAGDVPSARDLSNGIATLSDDNGIAAPSDADVDGKFGLRSLLMLAPKCPRCINGRCRKNGRVGPC